MDVYLSERDADQAAIQTLLAVIQSVQQTKQGTVMKILQDLKGAYYLAKEYAPLVEKDAKKIIEHAEHDLAMAQKFLQEEAAKVVSAIEDQPTTTAPATATEQPTPEQPAVPTEQTQPAPVEQPTTVQADQPPQQPVADPGQVPAPVVSAPVDQNQPQSQPAQPAQTAPFDPTQYPPLQ